MATSTFLAPFTKLAAAVQQRGWKGMITQLYTIGDLKFGELKGSDSFGNKYYENLDLPYGQHRWVEYADIHNPDATMIQPEWHGWMHHMFDETPNDPQRVVPIATTHADSHAIFGHHVGLVTSSHADDRAQVDTSQYRQRGYRVGSLMTSEDEPDFYYKQPGHPLSAEADKRFKDLKGASTWVPGADKDKK
eukprot:CAMPEP_0181347456 /NCGR_PEP_ID=MMETSP1101-20121128/33890_1 /TAXON_ID=46948 /ORGANISM="Rhodomonas abbreviata, Strain Caron Lab Isolate" /LENGTH=190 /DNA_ID=CAMNT_0023459675 /DNA_START=35 /DNA_END=607 /DNA_ORIENTATION=-